MKVIGNLGDFSVIFIKEGIADSLGLDMYEAHRDREEMPELDLDLPTSVKKLEELINAMLSFQPTKRPSSTDVYSELVAINLKVKQKPQSGP